MTIRTRNKLSLTLFCISIGLLVLNITMFFIQLTRLDLLSVTDAASKFSELDGFKFVLFEHKPFYIYLSLLTLNLYVSGAAFYITTQFEKTQCSEIVYFLCFLIAVLSETARIYIPLLNLESTFSNMLFICGNGSAFSRILAPLALLFSVVLSDESQHKNIERNCILILISSLLFAIIIPLNTANIDENFRVTIGFESIVKMIEILIYSISCIMLFIYNYRNERKQFTSFGMAFIITGFMMMIKTVNLILYIPAFLFIFCGSAVYLRSLHNQHIYN